MGKETARGAVVTLDAGGEWVSVRGHGGILEYGEEVLRLRAGKGEVRIEGKGLMLESMDGEDVMVAGRVESVRCC